MGFLLHDGKLRVMEKKRTNSGPFMESTSKHSIYPSPLGKKLWELRKKHLASGEPLLTLDEVRREVQVRRGGIADEEDEA
jgi:hypothetical protein